MPLLVRRTAILSKIENPYGQDASPVGTDALLIRNLNVTPIQSDVVSRDLIRDYLGNSEQLLAQTRVQLSFEVEMAGSGTAGTAPKYDALLRACSLSSTTTAAAVTGSAVAGSANSITLAAAASGVDDFYKGMIISITSGTGSGHVGVITDYVGSTKVATVQASTATFAPAAASGYSIAPNVRYVPVSSSFESATIYVYVGGGVLHRVTGCRGTFSLNATVNQIPTINFEMTGIYSDPTDSTLSSTTYTAQATPQIFKAGNASAFGLLGYSGCLQAFSFNMANETVYRELVGCTKEVVITNRAPAGEVTIEAPTMAQRNYFQVANSNTTGALSFLHGTNAGNRVSFAAQRVDITNPSYSDLDGIQMLTAPYVAIPTGVGNNEMALVVS